MARARKKTTKKTTKKKAKKSAARSPAKKAPKKRAKAKPAKKRTRAVQQQMPGTKDPRQNDALDNLIRKVYDLNRTRQAAQNEENTERERLRQRMIELKIVGKYQTHDGLVAERTTTVDKVKIKAIDKSADVKLDDAG